MKTKRTSPFTGSEIVIDFPKDGETDVWEAHAKSKNAALSSHQKRLAKIKQVKKILSLIKVGLPSRVEFHFAKGTVTSFPKERKWVIVPEGKMKTIHIIPEGQRNDVTKFKARRFLKLAIAGLLRNDQ